MIANIPPAIKSLAGLVVDPRVHLHLRLHPGVVAGDCEIVRRHEGDEVVEVRGIAILRRGAGRVAFDIIDGIFVHAGRVMGGKIIFVECFLKIVDAPELAVDE